MSITCFFEPCDSERRCNKHIHELKSHSGNLYFTFSFYKIGEYCLETAVFTLFHFLWWREAFAMSRRFRWDGFAWSVLQRTKQLLYNLQKLRKRVCGVLTRTVVFTRHLFHLQPSSFYKCFYTVRLKVEINRVFFLKFHGCIITSRDFYNCSNGQACSHNYRNEDVCQSVKP